MKVFTGILAVLCGVNVLVGVFSHVFLISDFSSGFMQRMMGDISIALVGFLFWSVLFIAFTFKRTDGEERTTPSP